MPRGQGQNCRDFSAQTRAELSIDESGELHLTTHLIPSEEDIPVTVQDAEAVRDEQLHALILAMELTGEELTPLDILELKNSFTITFKCDGKDCPAIRPEVHSDWVNKGSYDFCPECQENGTMQETLAQAKS